jgi:hypothetical protein
MGVDISMLFERVKQVDLEGIVEVTQETAGEDDQQIIVVKLFRLRGAFKNDKADCFRMFIGVDSPEARPNDLRFLVPRVEECEATSIELTIYMDANNKLYFGAHKWNPEDKMVSFSYALIVPADLPDFPDTPLLQRMLQNMYEGLLFHDVKRMEWSIGADDMLSEEDKKVKATRLHDVYKKLTSYRTAQDGSV